MNTKLGWLHERPCSFTALMNLQMDSHSKWCFYAFAEVQVKKRTMGIRPTRKIYCVISRNKSRRHSTTTNETPLVKKDRNENVTILSA